MTMPEWIAIAGLTYVALVFLIVRGFAVAKDHDDE